MQVLCILFSFPRRNALFFLGFVLETDKEKSLGQNKTAMALLSLPSSLPELVLSDLPADLPCACNMQWSGPPAKKRRKFSLPSELPLLPDNEVDILEDRAVVVPAIPADLTSRNTSTDIVFAGDFSGMEIAFEAAQEVANAHGCSLAHAWSSDNNAACRSSLAVLFGFSLFNAAFNSQKIEGLACLSIEWTPSEKTSSLLLGLKRNDSGMSNGQDLIMKLRVYFFFGLGFSFVLLISGMLKEVAFSMFTARYGKL